MKTIVFSDAEAEAALEAKLAAGIEQIRAARTAAQGDIAVAEAQRDLAVAAKADAEAQAALIAGFTPGATYRQADIIAIRNQMGALLQRQIKVIEAITGAYTYRIAVDEDAVKQHTALLWVAKYVSGELSGDDTPPIDEEP